MRFSRLGQAAVIAAVAAITLTSCAANEGPAATGDSSSSGSASTLEGTLNGIGASSQGSAQEAWVSAFQQANTGVTVNYSPDGSGAGREAFIAGGADFAGSDRALKLEELDGSFGKCVDGTSAIDVPAYISPIAIVFNVEGVDELNLDAATIAGIFKGTITTWNAPEIAALNPDATLPSSNITAVHRSDDSGTTENFAAYLNATAPTVWDAEPDGVWPYQGGEAAQGTSGVIDTVTNGQNTIGYADASRAGSLGTAKVKVGDDFVAYSPEAAAAIVDASPEATDRPENDIVYEIDYASEEAGVYPVVLVSYLIACQEYQDAATGELVKAYLGYVTSEEGQQEAATSAGAAPLSSELSTQVATAIESIK
ncbi:MULTISPECIES: phosphate ABC transporter substrate-binding protein PstS [unclassified Rathayibacter]|uniref:phosphate ABC transporter substrate-binding protein PstS n=1 Tax=unclassified Rathayibacter TaxID=2609250 RepID=UPI00104C7265|nr:MULTISPECIES: phosphate ABC transporter substrate-binding protein PstS [unclassified Rathayibacter]MCJ1705592.1 phosphate ABC transporter substrate-binding protein PstS [Rathayibacter sp. VKM Ac-2926]TCL84792.1 phosphate ABC transporter substrate-binding protein (PhoT family) [Rathayibacter sp. PhB192]TCM30510.1 phosphate ABC transporter substrate-binding protein (PhoT family) [Rathayibacter sp. PhB179]